MCVCVCWCGGGIGSSIQSTPSWLAVRSGITLHSSMCVWVDGGIGSSFQSAPSWLAVRSGITSHSSKCVCVCVCVWVERKNITLNHCKCRTNRTQLGSNDNHSRKCRTLDCYHLHSAMDMYSLIWCPASKAVAHPFRNGVTVRLRKFGGRTHHIDT